ncbi:AAA family ATPase [Pseudomonas serbica]|jgi:hypothetical protein
MTLFKPLLKVNQLLVLQGNHRAFDCVFHSGVNVVRGRNSSGKTTIMDLIAYSLGAENIRWKPEALKCSSTFVEIQLNAGVATLQREISTDIQRPIAIFWGPLEAALQAGPGQWELYPFKRSEKKFSFSQAIFGALELPQAQGDGASNLTMHQLLRVLYADQPSVHSPIFRLDSFDSSLTREMIGGYLCGVYDDELYTAQLRIREVNKLLDKKVSELRGILSVLGKSGQTPDLDMARSRIPDLEAKRDELTQAYIALKETRKVTAKESGAALSKADGLRKKLNSARNYESILKDALASEEFDISDSKLFLNELNSRLRSLEESKNTRSLFGQISFHFCPSCLSEIKPGAADSHHCRLCTAELSDGGDSQVLRMKNEIQIQIKESTILLAQKEQKVFQLQQDIPLATKEVKRLEKEYRSVSSTWSSDVETILEGLSRQLGAIDEEIRQAYEQQKLSGVIAELQKQRDLLQTEFNGLQDTIEALELRQESRKVEVSKAVEKHMIRLLQLDLPLQTEFINPHTVTFDFVDNSVYVNGSKNFSESSAVVLRHIFHLALFTTSMEMPFMRVPKFMMLDGIDDGGMEKERSHNLQEIIVSESKRYKVDFQIVFATSEINPLIESSDLVVGRYFNPEARSLDVINLLV